MKYLALTLSILTLSYLTFAQDDVRVTDLSKKYDLVSKQSNCKEDWRGRICDETFQVFRKNARKHFQSITIRSGDEPPIFGDFNFDGYEDIALCDGKNGGYLTSSYSVYLYSHSRARFVFSPSFTKLAQGPEMGFFEVDKQRKTLTTGSKMGYGYFTESKYDVYRGKPRLIYEMTHDESSAEGIWATITTKKLINGKWRTWRKRERIEPISTK